MTRKTSIELFLENFVEDQLEEMTFRELLEEFDLTPSEVFIKLYFSGMIDEELIEDLRKS